MVSSTLAIIYRPLVVWEEPKQECKADEKASTRQTSCGVAFGRPAPPWENALSIHEPENLVSAKTGSSAELGDS